MDDRPPMSPLGRAWIESVAVLGGADPDGAAALENAYAQAHRRYHTTAHVEAVLRDSAVLAADLGLDDRARAQVQLAACAHDVVYEGRAGADEQASAAWAAGRLRAAGVGQRDLDVVHRLVLATATHEIDPDDTLAAVLMDADLAVLGSTPADYAIYVAAVREEYRHVPDDGWRAGRGAVLASLLDRPILYVTGSARGRWDARARTNMREELAALA